MDTIIAILIFLIPVLTSILTVVCISYFSDQKNMRETLNNLIIHDLFQIIFDTRIILFHISSIGFYACIYFRNITIVILAIVVLLFIYYLFCLFEQNKQETFRAWAKLHDWSYNRYDKGKISRRYSNLNQLQQGSNQYAFDVLKGTWKKYSAIAFNFHYETYSTSSSGGGGGIYGGVGYRGTTTTTNHHYFGVVIVHIEHFFPKLQIYPKNIFGRIRNALGFGGINFESVEFSQRFTVCCQKPKFAYDFCHPRMIEYLLTKKSMVIELEGNILALFNNNKNMNPDKVEESLNQLTQLRELMPKYLFRN